MKYFFIFSLTLFSGTFTFGQNLHPNDSTWLIKLTLTDKKNLPLETEVIFQNTGSKKELRFKTTKTGKANFLVPNSASYSISIPNSGSKYEYEIPDFPGVTKEINLQFDMTGGKNIASTFNDAKDNKKTGDSKNTRDYYPEEQALFYLYSFNIPKGTSIKLQQVGDTSKKFITNQESVSWILPNNKSYEFKIKGVNIKDDRINIDSKPFTVLYYILFFTSDNSAVLYITDKNAVMNFVFTNLNNKKIANEMINLVAEKSKNVRK